MEKEKQKYLDVALNYVQRYVRSRHELAEYLRKKGAEESDIEAVVEECVAIGVVNDATCAQLWAQHHARRGYGWRVVQHKLLPKKLDAEAMQYARESIADEEYEQAFAVARKQIVRYHGDQKFVQKKKLYQKLTQRGYESSLVERVVREINENG